MKILKTVSIDKIPSKLNTQGAKRNPKYDALVEKILSLPDGKSLPIECESKNELNSLRSILKKRSNEIVLVSRGLTLYASKG